MARKPLSDEALLGISRACAELLVRTGGGARAAELVNASGLSERTFFRYFPTKAECLRPLFDHGIHRFAEAFAERVQHDPSEISRAIADALVAAYAEESLPWGRDLMRLVIDTPSLRRIWLEANEAATELLLAPISSALRADADAEASTETGGRTGSGADPDPVEVRMAADLATLLATSAIRRMVLLGEDAAAAAESTVTAFHQNPLSRTIERESARMRDEHAMNAHANAR